MKKIVLALMVVLLAACGKDESPDVISLNDSEVPLYYGDNYQIEAESRSSVTFESENDYHASVTTDGLVTARYVGETNISISNAEDSKLLRITVQPKYDLYPEPDVEFGTLKADIISHFGDPTSDTGSAIGYDDYSYGAPILLFAFDDYDRVTGYAVMIDPNKMERLVNFIGERYFPVGSKDGVLTFANGLAPEKASVGIVVYLYDSSYIAAMYLPFSSLKSASLRPCSIFDEVLEAILNE
ncbi:Ig-like domain-containing protein [Geofilum rhodophaeum]|uniref:Ig-like domain-containing protein n=1 Tax=Geofilum rhodophaeum TaxID=1965019 RepID=UPI000B521D1D|nr:Ig-like domain-containing protein [Geofilum rhodophaeum]